MPVEDSRMEIVQGKEHVATLTAAHNKRLQTDASYKIDDDYVMNDHPLRVTNDKSWAKMMNDTSRPMN